MFTLVDFNNMGLLSAAPPAMQVGKVPHKLSSPRYFVTSLALRELLIKNNGIWCYAKCNNNLCMKLFMHETANSTSIGSTVGPSSVVTGKLPQLCKFIPIAIQPQLVQACINNQM